MSARSEVEPAADSGQVVLSQTQFKELMKAAAGGTQGFTPELLEQILARTQAATASAMQKAMKPENAHAPGISAFSYPEGDLARPRPKLPFELFWKGYPVHKEPGLATWWEIEEYLKLKPGSYTCSRRDGAPVKVTVSAEYGPDDEITRLTVDFPVDRESRMMLPSPYVWCRQMSSDKPHQESFVDAMSDVLRIALEDQKAKAAPRRVA